MPAPAPPNRPLLGLAYALAGTALVSTNYVTGKVALATDGGLNSATFCLAWTAAAALYTLAIMGLRGRWGLLALPRGTRWPVLGMGFATCFSMLLGWEGLALLDPSFNAFLWRFQPALTILLGALVLGERLGASELLLLAAMGAGGVLAVGGRWGEVGAGTALTLCACLAGALQLLPAKALTGRVHADALVFWRVALAAGFIALWTLAGTCLWPGRLPLGRLDFGAGGGLAWGALAVGSLFGPCLSFLLFFRSYRYWELARSSLVGMSEPLFALPLCLLFLGTVPQPDQLLGGLVILVAATLLLAVHRRRKLLAGAGEGCRL